MQARKTLAGFLVVLVLPALALAQVDEGRARFVPWSGYWWKIQEGRMLKPLGKYDSLTGRSAMSHEARTKDRRTSPGWAGYCHAWSAASIMEPEPKRPKTILGPNGRRMTLSVGDQKAWLTVCHDGDDAVSYGNRYNGSGDDLQDIYPDNLWRYLRMYVKSRGVPLVLDIDPRSAVWNYPVYRYKVTVRPFGGADMRLGRMEIWMADDKVQPDFVGTRVKKKTYQFTYQATSGISPKMGTGRWYGASRNDHPDFAWYPTTVSPKNPSIDHAMVRRMLGVNGRLVAGRSTPDSENDAVEIDNDNLIAVSSTELAVLLAGSSSDFALELRVENEGGGKLSGGSPLAIRGKSAKEGYLYLLHQTPAGQVKLLYPLPGQENKVKAERPFRIGKVGDSREGWFVAPTASGTHRITGIVTAKPLDLGSLIEEEEAAQVTKNGFSRAFEWSESEDEVVRNLLGQVTAGKLTLEGLEETTGTKAADLLGAFGRKQLTFQVEVKTAAK